jgi:hypothetical protein
MNMKDHSTTVTREYLHHYVQGLTGEIRKLCVVLRYDTDFKPITVSRPSSSVVT